jgi:hypothetical protein
MKLALMLAALAFTLKPAAALEVGDSPAMRQAGAVQTSGSASVYDNNPSRGGLSLDTSGGNTVREASEPCADETCGLRRGGGPSSELRREPKSPFTREKEDADNAKKHDGKFNWMGLVPIVGGAAAGALAGFLLGGPWGALIGGLIGGALGWLGPKLLH